MEASVAYGETGKLPRVAVRVLAALDGGGNEAVLEQLFVEEAGVSAEVSNQVADLGPDGSILVHNKHFELVINVRIVDVLVEVL